MSEKVINKPQLTFKDNVIFIPRPKKYICLDNLEGEEERILRFKEELVHNSEDA